MKTLLQPVFVFFAFVSFGQQARIQTLKRRNPITKEIYVFPKVVTASFESTKKMNNAMRETVLSIPANVTDTNLFDSVWRTEARPGSVSDLSFHVSEFNSKLISLSISGQGCGAYCEPFTYYFTFNARTGNRLTLDSLFTPAGIEKLIHNLNYNRRKKLGNKLKQLSGSLHRRGVKNNQDEKNRILEQKHLYSECLSKTVDKAYVSEIEFLSKAGAITVYTNRCSAHYNMTLDDLWTFQYHVELKDYAKLLTQFGNAQVQ